MHRSQHIRPMPHDKTQHFTITYFQVASVTLTTAITTARNTKEPRTSLTLITSWALKTWESQPVSKGTWRPKALKLSLKAVLRCWSFGPFALPHRLFSFARSDRRSADWPPNCDVLLHFSKSSLYPFSHTNSLLNFHRIRTEHSMALPFQTLCRQTRTVHVHDVLSHTEITCYVQGGGVAPGWSMQKTCALFRARLPWWLRPVIYP